MAGARHAPALAPLHPDAQEAIMRKIIMVVLVAVLGLLAAAPASAASSIGTELGPDRQLNSGDWIESGGYRLAMQTDGNLVLYGPGGPLWATYTRSDGAVLVNQGDGNLVIYTADRNGVVWSSRTNGRGASRLVAQSDGNVVLYGPGGPTWSTYTNGGASKMAATGAIAFARAQIGKWYQYGGTGPTTYDCSGLTQKAYASVGVGLNRVTTDQWKQGRQISRAELQPGDLVFSNNLGHVALYIGNDEVIQALKTGTQIGYYNIGYAGPIYGYRRMA
jgi:hypothetical protein